MIGVYIAIIALNVAVLILHIRYESLRRNIKQVDVRLGDRCKVMLASLKSIDGKLEDAFTLTGLVLSTSDEVVRLKAKVDGINANQSVTKRLDRDKLFTGIDYGQNGSSITLTMTQDNDGNITVVDEQHKPKLSSRYIPTHGEAGNFLSMTKPAGPEFVVGQVPKDYDKVTRPRTECTCRQKGNPRMWLHGIQCPIWKEWNDKGPA